METLGMSVRERRRLEVLSRVRGGDVTLVKAAELLGLSYRQVKRVYARYRTEGDAGLVHRLRGRPSNRRTEEDVKGRSLDLYREKYWDFGATLASEYLEHEDQVVVAVETLRGWLLSAGLLQRRRQRKAHRCRRPRKEHLGEMVQMDGSHHDWFEGRRDWAVLMVMIDDATSRVYARFFESETTVAAMETLWRYVERNGVPHSLYVDRDSIYRCDREATGEEILGGKEPVTQFGRAMEDLDVKLILAGSPQAKGRVERANGTLQDRLVKALRRAGISDLVSANEFLEEEFLAGLNARFAIEAVRAADLHRRVPRGVRMERVFSFQEPRVVQNDWTVRWQNRWFQLTGANKKLSLVGRRVTVCEHLSGTIELLLQGRALAWEELPGCPVKQVSHGEVEIRSNQGRRPSLDHPWRKFRLPGTPGARPATATG